MIFQNFTCFNLWGFKRLLFKNPKLNNCTIKEYLPMSNIILKIIKNDLSASVNLNV